MSLKRLSTGRFRLGGEARVLNDTSESPEGGEEDVGKGPSQGFPVGRPCIVDAIYCMLCTYPSIY